MAKYIGSPWGQILGKLNGSVGGKWKGINWVRVLVHPAQQGSLEKYRMYKDGLIGIPPFSFPQMNIRRASLQVLGYVARTNLSNFINIIWYDYVQKHALVMTPSNAFVQKSAALLYYSMPNIDQEFVVGANEPDLKVIKMSDGDLEGTPILTAVYVPGTGVLTVTWDKTCYTNGLPTDLTWIVVAKKPILESVGRNGTWMPKLFMYGPYNPPALGTTRAAEVAVYPLPIGLTIADLTVYLFFRDSLNSIGYSISNSKTAA